MLKVAPLITKLPGKGLSCRTFAIARTNIVVPQPIVVQSPETKITTLASGFRVASQSSQHQTATVGVYIDAGSRYENDENNGVAHFLEHMAFKGTKKRSQMTLELEVEEIGAHLNAYTSREHTIYYAKCFNYDLEKDILLHSVYGKQEIEREKGVIIRESEEIDQNMQEVVFDRLHAGAFQGCSLGRTILGSIKNIQSMQREDLVDYVKTYYKGPRMTLAAAGGVEHDHLVSVAEKYFGSIQRGSDKVLDYEKGVFSEHCEITDKPEMELVYGCLSVEGTSWTHPLTLAMQVASGVSFYLINTFYAQLTGQYDRTQGCGISMPSRLALKMGKLTRVASFLSFTTNYKDTGLTGIYFVADPDGVPGILEAICEEWRSYSELVDEKTLNRAKSSLFNNMLLMLDGTTPVCEDVGRQLLCYGRRMSVPELKARINAVDVNTIKEMFNSFYLNKPIALNILGPAKHCPKFESVKAWLST